MRGVKSNKIQSMCLNYSMVWFVLHKENKTNWDKGQIAAHLHRFDSTGVKYALFLEVCISVFHTSIDVIANAQLK